MPKSIILTFADDDEVTKFVEFIERHLQNDEDEELIRAVLARRSEETQLIRQQSLFVSGKHICDGTPKEMQAKFEQEITSHSGSVEIRELRAGNWAVIRKRNKSLW